MLPYFIGIWCVHMCILVKRVKFFDEDIYFSYTCIYVYIKYITVHLLSVINPIDFLTRKPLSDVWEWHDVE